MKSRRVPYLLVTQRGVGQRHGRRLGAGHGRGRRLQRRARPGPDQRDDRDRRGAARQRADRRASSPTSTAARTPRRPGPLAAQRRDPPADLQGGPRGPPPGRDPRRDPRGVPDRPVRRAGPGRGRPPVPLLDRGLGLRRRVPPPYPVPFDEAGLSAGARPAVGPAAPGRDLRGDGLPRRRPGAGGRRRDPPGAGGDLGQRQGVRSPTRTRWPSAGATGRRGPGRPRRRSRRSTSSWPSGSSTARSRRRTTRSPSTTS